MKRAILSVAIATLLPQLAQAQSVTITGDTTGQPLWARPDFDGSPLVDPAYISPYQSYQVTITNSLGFDASLQGAPSGSGTLADPALFLYTGVFDPAQQTLNFFSADDDGGLGFESFLAGNPPLGEYTIVVTSYYDGNSPGTYTLLLNGAVIGWAPLPPGFTLPLGLSSAEQIDELRSAIAQSGRQTLRALATNTAAAAQQSLSAGTSTVTSTMGAGGKLAGHLNVWGKLSNTHGVGARDLKLPTLQLGADFAITPDMVAGLAVARGSIKSATTGLSVSGKQTIVQPYLGWRNGDLHGSASLSFGRIKYDTITTTAGVASAKGTLSGFSADVAKDFAIGGGRSASPFASLNIGQVKLKDTTGTLAAAGIPDNVRFREIRLGTTFAMAMGPGVGKLTVSADHFGTNAPIAISSGTFDEKGWSGTIGLGYQAQMASGWTVDAELNAGGLGSDTRQVQGGLKIGFKF